MKTLNIDLERDREQAIRWLEKMPLRKYSIRITDRKSSRSLAQNSLLWVWIKVIAKETGHTEREIHDLVVDQFSPVTVGEVMGKIVVRQRGTSDLNMQEFTDLLNRVEAWAAGDLGIALPQPEDQYYEAMGIRHERTDETDARSN